MSEVPDPLEELRRIVNEVMVDFNRTKRLPSEELCSQVILFATIEIQAASAAGLPRPTTYDHFVDAVAAFDTFYPSDDVYDFNDE